MPDSNSSNGEVLTQVLKKIRSSEKGGCALVLGFYEILGFVGDGRDLYTLLFDSQEILQRFSAAHHLGYPCLSDKASVVIREFGILGCPLTVHNL